jgi:hypothetical protein
MLIFQDQSSVFFLDVSFEVSGLGVSFNFLGFLLFHGGVGGGFQFGNDSQQLSLNGGQMLDGLVVDSVQVDISSFVIDITGSNLLGSSGVDSVDVIHDFSKGFGVFFGVDVQEVSESFQYGC